MSRGNIFWIIWGEIMQMTSRFTTAMLTSLALGFPMITSAQTPAVNTANVAAECAKSAALCKAAVAAAIAELRALGLTPTQLNTQLGVLAGAALSGAQSLPAAEKLALAGILTSISAQSTNPAQIAALNELAVQLSSGSTVNLTAVASAFSSN